MQQYVAFLRGINVGGNALIKMDALKTCLSAAGLRDVRTYIQSGNIIFSSDITDKSQLAAVITAKITQTFHLEVAAAIFTKTEWLRAVDEAPDWWGNDPDWKHNVLIVIPPTNAEAAMAAIGTTKPDIEALQAGNGILYQSIAWKAVSRGVTGSKLAAKQIYKQMTVRNYNTATKLAALLSEVS